MTSFKTIRALLVLTAVLSHATIGRAEAVADDIAKSKNVSIFQLIESWLQYIVHQIGSSGNSTEVRPPPPPAVNATIIIGPPVNNGTVSASGNSTGSVNGNAIASLPPPTSIAANVTVPSNSSSSLSTTSPPANADAA